MLGLSSPTQKTMYKIFRPSIKKQALLSLLPIVIVGIYIFAFGLNIPFWDQWGVVPLLVKQHQGTLVFADLIAQHNEHRPLFPRLIWITSAYLTNYNVNVELWINFIIAVITLGIFLWQTVHMWIELGVKATGFFVPLTVLLVFNLGQWESWLMGFQTVMFLGMACVVIGFFAIARLSGYWGLVVGIFLGFISTYSMVNGLFYWPIGVLVIYACSERQRVIRCIIWMISSFICVGYFLFTWKTESELGWVYLIHNLPIWIIWLLNFLGAPLFTHYYVAWGFGILSLILLSMISVQVLQRHHIVAIMPYISIILFVVATAIVISLGRIVGGMPNSVTSRYLTITDWYWASLLALIPFAGIKMKYQNVLQGLFATTLIVCMLCGGILGYYWRYQRTLPAYQAIVTGSPPSDENLVAIYGVDLQTVRSRLDILCSYKWSVCRYAP